MNYVLQYNSNKTKLLSVAPKPLYVFYTIQYIAPVGALYIDVTTGSYVSKFCQLHPNLLMFFVQYSILRR